MGSGRDTLWIDPVSRSPSFKLFGVRELSPLHDTLKAMVFLLITFTQAVFRAPILPRLL